MRPVAIVLGLMFVMGCATLNDRAHMGADQVAQVFMDDIQNSKPQDAYGLLSKEMEQKVSFDQFKNVVDDMANRWGSLESSETVVMPFHLRPDDSDVIPSDVPKEKIKRYTFSIKFEKASANCDLTLIPQDDHYVIGWFSFWK